MRHTQTCKHNKDRNYNRCGCPIWINNPDAPRGKQRYSAHTNDWNEAMRQAADESKKTEPRKRISVADAVNLYLIKRWKKANDAGAHWRATRWKGAASPGTGGPCSLRCTPNGLHL